MTDISDLISDVSHVLSKDDVSFRTQWFEAPMHLNHAVESMWVFDWNVSEHVSKLIPEPCVHLIVEGPWSRVVGPSSRPFQRTVSGIGRMVGFKCRLGGFRSVWDVDVSTISDWQVPLRFAGFDTQSFIDATDIERLWELLTPHVSPNCDEVARAIALSEFVSKNPDSAIDVIAQQFSLTPRSVQRSFKQYVGVSPKAVAMRFKMRDAVSDLKQGTQVVDVSNKNGFFDQAHFTKTFRKATGETPNAFKTMHEDE